MKNNRGISNVIGGAVMILCFIVAILPTMLYVQNITTEYDYSAAVMRRIDEEKLRENMNIVLYAEEHSLPILTMNMTNPSAMWVKVVRVWLLIDDPVKGELVSKLGMNVTIPPSETAIFYFVYFVHPLREGTKYFVKAITERGNIFTPSEPFIYTAPYTPPAGAYRYGLTVTINDTKSGETYAIIIDGEMVYKQKISAGHEQAISVTFGFNEAGMHHIKVLSTWGGALFDAYVPVPEIDVIVTYEKAHNKTCKGKGCESPR